ncbi:MAG: glycerol-3-phosphate dehydrogenase [Sedimentisphaerales bacterium]|nr:glycerol-3-phosphate dehydrogenase [Sedimentisphaerales bacterium]
MKRHPEKLTQSTFDLIIIGGGINGAGCARDAAMRGLKVALIDKSDFASGTSSASTHLVHGGVRYLEQCAFGLVRESLRERRTLLEIAPHIVRPLRFHIPVYKGQKKGRFILKCGLTLYDMLAGKRNIKKHRLVKASELTGTHADFHGKNLKGGLEYYDAWMDDARLCLANVIDADRHGAVVVNYVEAVDVAGQDGEYEVTVKDCVSGETLKVRGRAILNTTGPWSDGFIGRTLKKDVKRLQPSKGVHLVFDRPMPDSAVLMFASDDRIFFLIPFYGKTMVGTTDTAFDGDPDGLKVSPEDIDYLIESISHYQATPQQWRESLVGSFAGLRPLVAQQGKGTYGTSREHLIVEDQPGFFSVAGGKFTTYRSMSEEIVDRLCSHLGNHQPCVTAARALPGGDISDYTTWSAAMAAKLEGRINDKEMCEYLMRTFGSEVEAFVNRYADSAEMLERVDPATAVPRAMLDYSKEHEMAVTDEDLFRRRTPLKLLGYRGTSEGI